MGSGLSSALVPKTTTCAHVLGRGDINLKVGGFCGYNFVVDNNQDVELPFGVALAVIWVTICPGGGCLV